MYALLGGEKPKRKVSARIKVGDLDIQYVAASTREHIIGSVNGEVVGSIYISARVVKDLDMKVEKVQVAGSRWEDLRFVAGLLPDDEPVPEHTIEWDKSPKGNTNKIKSLEYRDLANAGSVSAAKLNGGIEDYLYENVPIEELKEQFDLSWADDKDYRILIEDDEIHEWVEGLAQTDDIVGFDTETTGLLVNRTKRDKLVGISMSYEDHTGVYFPIAHERFENVRMGTKKLLDLLKPYCDRGSKKAKELVTHNGGYDWRVMKMHDWDLNIVYDTFIRQGLSAISEAKSIRKLKDIARKVLGYDVVELEDMYRSRTKQEIAAVKDAVFGGGASVNDITRFKLETAEKQSYLMDFRYASRDFSELYGSADADFPRLLHKIMDKEWDKTLDLIYRAEIELIPVIGEQEYYGIHAKREDFDVLHENALKRMEELEELIYKEAGRRFNIGSSQQKAEVLFDHLKLPFLPRFKTKKGGRSTDKKVMETLEQYKDSKGNTKYPIIPLMREYTKLQTLVNNFYSKLPKRIVDNFIFSSYKQLGTETGRLSNSQPNLQQTEPVSRAYMTPDSDDYYFMICDYSQVEYRIMAGLSGEDKVTSFFAANKEADYHILAYANMMNKAYEDVTSAERKTGKVLNFGTSYGLEDENLALNLYGDTTPFHQKMAREARKKYFDGVPKLRDYFESVRDEAERVGYAKTLFGRKRIIHEFAYSRGRVSEYKRGSGRRKAGNMPVQGTAADIMKFAMVRVRNLFRKYGHTEEEARMVLNVHDELVMQVHKKLNPWYVCMIMREAMEMDLSKYGFPPLYIGANVGYCWKDGKEDELEAPVILMDEKIAEVKEMMDCGEELPTYDDPRKMWADEITKFALRVIKGEIQADGVKGLEKAHENGRLVKYSHHFGSASEAVIKELIVSTPEKVFKRLDKVQEFRSKLAYKHMGKINEIITSKGVKAYEDAAERDDIRRIARYFGKYSGNVVKWLIEDGLDSVFGTVHERIKEAGFKALELKKPAPKKTGVELEEEKETVISKAKSMLKYNKKTNHVRLIMEDNDTELFSLIDKMLIPQKNKKLFRDDLKFVTFELVYASGDSYKRSGWLWIANFFPIMRDMLITHLTGGSYAQYADRIEKVGSTFVKTEEQIKREEKRGIDTKPLSKAEIKRRQREYAKLTN